MCRRGLVLVFVALFVIAAAFAQLPDSQNDSEDSPNLQNQAPPRSDDSGVVSSSKDTRIDLSPPAGDAAMHPNSDVDDVLEMHPYNPHKAAKDVEVGDFYFNLKNYRAAESRYREALQYKSNDAEATYKLGMAQENLGETQEALVSFQNYLKILPYGPRAKDAQKAIERIINPPEDKEAKQERKDKKQKAR